MNELKQSNLDVVYPYKSYNWWVELKFSLRSLENLEHRNVYIAWWKEEWFNNINRIETEENWNRFENICNALRLVCNNENVSDDFIYMMDDIYIMKPYTPKRYYKSTLSEHINFLKTRDIYPCIYDKTIEKEFEYFWDREMYDCHRPVIFNKEKLLYVLDNYPWASYIWSYALHNNVQGEYKKDTTDIKRREWDEDLLASYDIIPIWMIWYLGKKFPNKSKYEK